MRTELLKKKTRSACANVTGGTVDSLRLKTETSTTVRVYDNGFIGIAGKIGDADEEALKKEAVKNIERKIPYPDLPDKPLYKSIIKGRVRLILLHAEPRNKSFERNPPIISHRIDRFALNVLRRSYAVSTERVFNRLYEFSRR